eukprot:6116651-Alexandrium_andersonii.AAC.1
MNWCAAAAPTMRDTADTSPTNKHELRGAQHDVAKARRPRHRGRGPNREGESNKKSRHAGST